MFILQNGFDLVLFCRYNVHFHILNNFQSHDVEKKNIIVNLSSSNKMFMS